MAEQRNTPPPPHRTIVIGHRGQDGTLLCQALRDRGDVLTGLGRHGAENLSGQAAPPPTVSLDDGRSIDALVRHVAPTQVYYLAAHHRSSERAGRPANVGADIGAGMLVNVQGPIHFLDAIRRSAPACRFFYASTSVIFGQRTADERQEESTQITPFCEYGLLKATGQLACQRYRREHGLFASVGILYNHESALRTGTFLSRKVIDAAMRIQGGSRETLTLGSLDARTDWSYAPDFVDAFRRILGADKPDDFIVASGRGHSVREFVSVAFGHLGLDWEKHVRVDGTLLDRAPSSRIGNPAKLMAATGWRPTVTFEGMIKTIIDQLTKARAGK
ncbi:MAG: GDP-mannose 4,6-dehydratase [Planctomycetota bacterium]|nr:GDP-mannose 4,6-dehydratase [Planctomycetota bacterium]